MWKFRFDPQGARLSDSGYDGLATIQTETVKQGIYSLSTALIGVLFIVIALVIQFAYPLNKKTVDENTAELAKRREAK
jgi:GPH family glycoside/pentoside/hexuronide:cation symporter